MTATDGRLIRTLTARERLCFTCPFPDECHPEHPLCPFNRPRVEKPKKPRRWDWLERFLMGLSPDESHCFLFAYKSYKRTPRQPSRASRA